MPWSCHICHIAWLAGHKPPVQHSNLCSQYTTRLLRCLIRSQTDLIIVTASEIIIYWVGIILSNSLMLVLSIRYYTAWLLPLLVFLLSRKQLTDSRTRSAARGDCIIPRRRTAFGQSAFSVRASHTWNSLPTAIRNNDTYHSFKIELCDAFSAVQRIVGQNNKKSILACMLQKAAGCSRTSWYLYIKSF